MKKKFVSLLITILFILSNYLIIDSVDGYVELQNTNKGNIYVDDDNKEGPWNGTIEFPFRYIQDAIENATERDIIYVFEGIYYENIEVYKPLTIIGENKSSTIIDGMYKEFVVRITADFTFLINFTIMNSGGYMHNAGIIIDSELNQIAKCIFYRTRTGIYINGSSYNEINNCTFYNNGEGIYIQSSQDNQIRDCYFCNNGLGLNIQSSDAIKIIGCYAHTNGIAFFFGDSTNIESIKCAAYNNNDNQGGFFMSNCGDIYISNCNIYHNGVGTKISNSTNIYILNCNLFWNTHFGVNLNKDSKNVIIEKCELFENLRYGIQSKKAIFN